MVDRKLPRPPRAKAPAAASQDRRNFLKTAATGTVAGVAAATTGMGFNIKTAKAQGTRWKMQSSWAPGTTGYKIFEEWAAKVGEVTGGELQIQPFPAGAVSGDFELVDAVRNGVLDGMNLFTVYWAGRMPAGVFFSSFPMALNHPHQWDMMYGAYGGTELVRELYEKNGLYFVGHVHHDMNLIHSKTPIRSLDDFAGVKLRMPAVSWRRHSRRWARGPPFCRAPMSIRRWKKVPSTQPTTPGRRSTTTSASSR